MEVIDSTEAVLPGLAEKPQSFTAGGHMFIYRGMMHLMRGAVAERWTSADGALEVMSRVEAGRLRLTIFQKFKFPKPEVGVSVAGAFFGRVAYRASLRRDGALCGYDVEQVAADAAL